MRFDGTVAAWVGLPADYDLKSPIFATPER
jgi:hypothetical protein